MILAHGKIIEESRQGEIIAALKDEIPLILAQEGLNPELVIAACDRLSLRAQAGEFDAVAKPLLEMAHLPYEAYLSYARMFSGEGLRKKMSLELAGYPLGLEEVTPHLFRKRVALGVLLHIAAGNVDVLPAYSVIEGLLAGNINLLKLPTGDKGLSVKLLSELIAEEPRLADYIYVFDVPSAEIETMKALARYANAIVVWGGDAAVKGVRELAEPNTKIIEWGHKLSFAYATSQATDEQLKRLAEDICRTNQVMCSSCQGIYLDTESDEETNLFAERFFEILRQKNLEMGKASLGMRAKAALNVDNEKLEGKSLVLSSDGVSVIVYPDEALTLSFLFRNVWIRKLPEQRIIPILRPYRGYLQSCALCCEEGKAQDLSNSLIKAGICRICDGGMSSFTEGESHDGTYPLKDYSRIVDCLK
jgi:hypothetical protein